MLDFELNRIKNSNVECGVKDCLEKMDLERTLTSMGSPLSGICDQVGSSKSKACFSVESMHSRSANSFELISVEEDKGVDPTTPGKDSYGFENLNLLGAEIEKAWTRVENR